MAKCATGAARLGTTLKNVTHLAIADTACNAAMMGLTAFAPTTYAMSLKIARFTPLTLTSKAATALPLTMTLTFKGC